MNEQNICFEDCLDTIFTINRMARENLGEDSFFCATDEGCALVGVFDGCGGLGARRYEKFDGHTGAYIASRAVSGAVHDWFFCKGKNTDSAGEMTKDLKTYIEKAYAICEKYAVERIKIRGSMVRKFPTTLAMVYAKKVSEGILAHIFWAGDSRVYLLDSDGLAQLTVDDTDVTDALENLTCDGAMNNVLSSDGNFQIHSKTILLTQPALLFAATDGCFGYVSSPMEFEYLLVKTLVNGKTPKEFKRNLEEEMGEYAGDDLTMGIMSFFFGDFPTTRRFFENRLHFLEKKYISVMEKQEKEVQELWEEYKVPYQRYLR